MSRSTVLVACFLVSWGLAGCGSATKTAVPEVDAAQLSKVPGIKVYHEWNNIYSIDVRDEEVTRKRVGYLDRVYSEEDREGKSFVRDLRHDERGFLLPGGKAFLLERSHGDREVWRDLGNTGFNDGVRKILGVPGRIKLEPVSSASTALPPKE